MDMDAPIFAKSSTETAAPRRKKLLMDKPLPKREKSSTDTAPTSKALSTTEKELARLGKHRTANDAPM
jgi:hypothetical protein